MPLRKKYSIANWVLSQDNVSPGDTVAFYCPKESREIHAEVLGFPSKEMRQYISCKRNGQDQSELINFYSTIVYRINGPIEKKSNSCTCGAKHTSNPKFHLNFCDIL